MEQRVIALGAYILDVLVRAVDEIPQGQGTKLVEQIHLGPAGAAGGTAVTLAKLGAAVRGAGALGSDPLGDLLLTLLESFSVDTSLMYRREGMQTASSVLPIRSDGSRPAFHVPGAGLTYGQEGISEADMTWATHLHIGGPELVGGEGISKILAPARKLGITVSADILAPATPDLLDWIKPCLSFIDYFLPNEEQVLGLTGAVDLSEGCRVLIGHGVGCVAATRGKFGAVVVTPEQIFTVPAFVTNVVDTTGCGDAFSAGFMRGLGLKRDLTSSAVLGNATAAIVAQGLGSDFGDFDLAAADNFAKETTTVPID